MCAAPAVESPVTNGTGPEAPKVSKRNASPKSRVKL